MAGWIEKSFEIRQTRKPLVCECLHELLCCEHITQLHFNTFFAQIARCVNLHLKNTHESRCASSKASWLHTVQWGRAGNILPVAWPVLRVFGWKLITRTGISQNNSRIIPQQDPGNPLFIPHLSPREIQFFINFLNHRKLTLRKYYRISPLYAPHVPLTKCLLYVHHISPLHTP